MGRTYDSKRAAEDNRLIGKDHIFNQYNSGNTVQNYQFEGLVNFRMGITYWTLYTFMESRTLYFQEVEIATRAH